MAGSRPQGVGGLGIESLETRRALAVVPTVQGIVTGNSGYFVGVDKTHGAELWRTDGTAQGTRLVKDIRPGAADANVSFWDAVAVGNTLYFTADDGIHGRELWKTDGTEAGTALVLDIATGTVQTSDADGNPIDVPASSNPSSLVVLGNALYFTAYDNEYSEVWKTDGTEAGTVMLTSPDTGDVEYGGLGKVGDMLYFSLRDASGTSALWTSDGTEGGTREVATGLSLQGGSPVAYGGKAVFGGNDGTANGLWITDGTAAGTTLLKAFDSSVPLNLTPATGALFFTADDGITGRELWKTDGTAPGTVLVKDIATGTAKSFDGDGNPIDVPASSYPVNLTAVGSLVLFSADDGKTGSELWKTDGTAAGTQLLKDLVPGTMKVDGKTEPKSGDPHGFTSFKGSTYFQSSTGDLWKTNGTSAGTTLVKKAANSGSGGGSGSYGSLAVVNGALLYGVAGANGADWFKSDGTTAGTVRFADVPPPPPTVTAVDAPAEGTYVAGEQLLLTVHFSDPVAVVGKPTLALTIGTKTKQAGYTGGGGSADLTFAYTVAKGDLDTDGIAVGKLAGTIRSSVSAKVNAALGLPAVNATAVRVDAVVPEVKTVAVAPGSYGALAPIALQVTFSEAVKVTGTPQIAVTIGKTVRQANYVSGDGTATLVFQVVPQTGDSAPKGIALAKTIVLPAGAGLTDLPGNAAKLALKPVKTSAVKVVG